jgi:exopolysaccharide biosynthesis polyprenyl glycosylphosphotransferase
VASQKLETLRPLLETPEAPRSTSYEVPERRRRRWWLPRRQAPALLFAFDVLAMLLAVYATGAYDAAQAVSAGLLCLLFVQAGLYRTRLTMSALDNVPALVGRSLTAPALTLAWSLLTGWYPAAPSHLLRTSLLFAVLVVLARVASYGVIKRVRSSGRIAHRTVILGAGRLGAELARQLRTHPEYGLAPIGFVDSDPYLPEPERPVPVIGDTEDLAAVIRGYRVRVVVVAFGSQRESRMVDILRTCDRLDCEIFFVPRLYEVHQTSRGMDAVWGLPLVRLGRPAFRSFTWRLKRVFDIVVSAAALVLFLPVLALCALAVRLEGGPGVLFRQERVGLDGRAFQLLKFRSMKPVDERESATRWNIADDDRVGPVGSVLRRTSLDEAPQLWNVLLGDMTLVGPRPERAHFVEQFQAVLPRYVDRHRVRVGLTGWAQVHGLRGDTSIEERARFDNYYIENWSLWADVKIIVRTVGAVVRGAGG